MGTLLLHVFMSFATFGLVYNHDGVQLVSVERNNLRWYGDSMLAYIIFCALFLVVWFCPFAFWKFGHDPANLKFKTLTDVQQNMKKILTLHTKGSKNYSSNQSEDAMGLSFQDMLTAVQDGHAITKAKKSVNVQPYVPTTLKRQFGMLKV